MHGDSAHSVILEKETMVFEKNGTYCRRNPSSLRNYIFFRHAGISWSQLG